MTQANDSAAHAPGRTPLADLLVGGVTGLIVVVSTLSYAALIARGPLAGLAAPIAASALLGAGLLGFFVARRSEIPGIVAGPQSAAAAIFASLVATIPRAAPPEVLTATLVAALYLAPLATGLWFVLLGRLGYARLIRFIPYPVIGGFMAGTGFLLVRGAVDLLAGDGARSRLFAPETLAHCLPGVGLAALLMVVPRFVRHPLTVPGLLVGAALVFWTLGGLSPGGFEALRAGGWLCETPASAGGIALLSPALALGADPRLLLGAMGAVATLGLVSAISLLLNYTALELALARDIELGRELESAGWANLASAAVGGLVGFPYLGTSLMARRVGAEGRWTGLATAAICALIALVGVQMIGFLPRFLLGGLVLYLGVDLLWDWVVGSFKRLPRVDYMIVLFILVIVWFWGFLQAVFVGCVLATVLFAVSYSQADVVRYHFSGATYRSSVDRHPDLVRLLGQNGDRIQVLVLQGFLFFGTAHSLVELVRDQLARRRVGWLILEFRLVTDIDSSVASGMVRLRQACEAAGIRVVLADLPPVVRNRLIRGGFALSEPGQPGVIVFDELEQAAEWCEDALLEELDPSLPGVAPPSDLLRIFEDPAAVRRLMDYAEVLTLAPGDALIREGERPDALYYLDEGRLRVTVLSPGGRRSRLRTLRSGSMVGEVGFFLRQPRVATVEAEEPCRVVRLSGAQLDRLRREEPALSATLYAWVVHELAERLAQTNDLLKVTMR